MTMVLFRDMIKDRPDAQEWCIESAGTWAEANIKASQFAREVMSARGLSLDAHRSRIVTPELLSTFNLILTMEQGQKESLQVEFPLISQRVFLFSEAAGSSGPIKDPYGMSLEHYQATANEIEGLLKRGMEHIVRLAAI
jgi:protein-tyrosine-phosphatase